MSHPSLTAAQAERLEMLAEECAEVIKECTKTLRHGYDSKNPNWGSSANTNRERLVAELTDVASIVTMMSHEDDFDLDKWGRNGGRPHGFEGVAYHAKLRYTHHHQKGSPHER